MSRTTQQSKAKKLRDTLYRYWNKDDQGFEDFEDFYEHKMDTITVHYDKLCV